ncbi:EAL domain-containing protein [Nitrosophilus kaiyonis]|uniref:EAL domain-containing protein n=1 Tax=Nitrosophilus kaiyonis TaxID=2930200 RepID=UPI0024904835|nr:GGDEF domain-containing phosphodiesterase [Nitrosophilus kaiyonis]
MGVDIKGFIKKEIKKEYFRFWIVKKNWKFLYKGLKSLLKNKPKAGELEEFGKECYENSIPFGEISIFLDIFSKKLSENEKKNLDKNKNSFAKGYIDARLPNEIINFTNQVHNNGIFVSKDKIIISKYLTFWLIEFIEHILYHTPAPETSEKKSDFGKWLKEYKGVYFDDEKIKKHFITLSSSMHHTAADAIFFYHEKEYFYFVLLYLDMLSFALQLQGLLSSLFLEEKLLSLYIDPVTEIPNRFQLQKDFKIFKNPTLLLVNIRDFSKINAIYGNRFGDSVLKIVAKFIETLDIIKVYRIFADEFAILVDSDKLAKKVFNDLDEKIVLKEIGYTVSFYGAYKKLSETALEECEYALINAKEKKLVNADEIKDLINQYKNELSLTNILKASLTTDSVVPFFQPIFDYKKGKINKYECLMRVIEKDKILNPGQFLDDLKKMPIYSEYTKTILNKSFETFKNTKYEFSVNFSVLDIENMYTVSYLKALIKQYPEVANRLTIEITESEAIKNYKTINNFIKEIKNYGVKISLDDFGTGFSNFSQISKLDLDYVKIDGSIISNILNDDKVKKIFYSILDLAKSMNLKTVAEFVSDKEIFEFLKDSDVDLAQGYFIGKPEPKLQEN